MPSLKRRVLSLAMPAALAVLATSVAATPVAMAAPHDYSVSGTLASDNFNRSRSSGWGKTSSGHTYQSGSTKALKVTGGKGTVALKPGHTVTSALPDAKTLDGRASLTVRLAKLPSANHGVFTALLLRREGRDYYSGTMRIDPKGQVTIKIERVTAAGRTQLLADKRVLKNAKAGTAYRFEFQVTGTDKVELAGRAWPSSGTAPAWQASVTDSSAKRITRSGHAAIQSYLSSKAKALTVAYDGLSYLSLRPTPAPTPTPSPTPTTAAPKPSPTPTTAAPRPTPTATTAAPTPTPTTAAPSPAPTTTAPTPSPTTAAPTPSPTTAAPTPPPTSSSGLRVGSQPVGTASYPVPSGAIYVAALGTTDGAGTASSPYGSLGVALKKAPAGSTIVLRAGTYHESVEVPFNKKLTIQAYPGEAVWFDGASTLSGWSASGSTWSTAWNHSFDHRVSFTTGKDETSWWVNPAYPMAGHPEQVWIDGVAQRQVGSASAVTAGTFYVDSSAKRLIIGSNPSGKKVEASTLQKAITVHGAGSTLRGFGIKRYAPTMAQFGAISVEVDDVSLENMVITQNSTIGLYSWGQRARYNKLTLTHNGSLGAGIATSSGVHVRNSDASFNNAERFNEAPVAAGIKTGKLTDSVFINNLFEGNLDSAGLWIDEKGKNMTIAGNRFTGNGRDGLGIELAVNVKVVNNVASRNGGSGIRVFDSQYVELWNNTLTGNTRDALRIMQDDGRPGQWDILYVNKAITVANNVVTLAPNGCQLVVMDTKNKVTGAAMGLTFKGNVYHRSSTSAPSTFICWANGSAGLAQYKSLDAFRAATGQDAQSVELVGTSILTSDNTLTTAARSATASAPVGVSQAVADLMGVASGWKGLGAVGPAITR